MKILGKEISTAAIVALIGITILIGTITYVVAQQFITIPANGNIQTPPELAAMPTALNFGTTLYGDTTPITKNLQLTNNGDTVTKPLKMTYTCAVGTITWTGETQTIAAHSSLTFTVTFTPSATPPTNGTWTGSMQIEYDS